MPAWFYICMEIKRCNLLVNVCLETDGFFGSHVFILTVKVSRKVCLFAIRTEK